MQQDPLYEFWRKRWIPAAYILAAGIVLTTSWLWCNRVQTNPQRAFWGMVSQNIAASSVTVSASQTTQENSVKQTVALSLGAENVAHAIVDVTQGGSKITTEVIGTPKKDYTRYTAISTPKSDTTPPVNTDKIIDVWANAPPQLFGQTVLGLGLSLGSVPVPIANAQGAANDEIIKQIRERSLYQVDFTTVKKEHKDGRLLYTYEVKTAPFVYVQILKMVAKHVGIASLDAVDPADYRELKVIPMHLTVDVRARQLVKVAYDGTSYAQSYSAYGVPVNASIPQKTIPLEELQKRFQGPAQ